MGSMRYMNVGLALCMAIVIAGVLVFKDSSEAAMQAVAVIGIVIGLTVGLWLDTRAKRRGKQAQ